MGLTTLNWWSIIGTYSGTMNNDEHSIAHWKILDKWLENNGKQWLVMENMQKP